MRHEVLCAGTLRGSELQIRADTGKERNYHGYLLFYHLHPYRTQKKIYSSVIIQIAICETKRKQLPYVWLLLF